MLRRLGTLAVAAVVLGGGALPGIGPNDPRIAVDAEKPPWRAVGRVQTELGSRCTGVLVAPRLVLTAAHCLYLPRVRRFIQPSSVHFLIGYAFGHFDGHAKATLLSVPSGYDPEHESVTAGSDWALLRLDVALPADRVLPLLRAPLPVGTALMLGGYEQDRSEVMDADPHCRVTGLFNAAGGVLMRHDCAGTSGTSGGPLLARAGDDGGWAIAGLQVAAEVSGVGGLGVAAWSLDPAAARPTTASGR